MNKIKKLKKYWFELLLILLFILKIIIVNVQPIYVKNYSHDDRLFVEEAVNITKGKWLGDYNDRTLSKGVTGVLFIALAYKLKIPFLLAQQIVYFFACVSFIYMLKNVIASKKILFLFYIVLLFNPISYSDAVSFVYRDGIYISLILFFLTFSFQVFFNYKNKIIKLIFYSILFGINYAFLYLCREENVMLYPYLLIAISIILGFIIKDKECDLKKTRIICVLGIPIRNIINIYSYYFLNKL